MIACTTVIFFCVVFSFFSGDVQNLCIQIGINWFVPPCSSICSSFLYFKLFIVIIVMISIIAYIFSSINIMIIIFSVCRSFNFVDVLVLVLKSI